MQLTTQLGGRKIVEVWRNGITLVFKCEDGYELVVGWRDPETGNPIKGEPVIVSVGKSINARHAEVFHRGELRL